MLPISTRLPRAPLFFLMLSGILLGLALRPIKAPAQTPGSVVVTSKLVAIAGNVNCEGTPNATGGVDTICKHGTLIVFSGVIAPPVGVASGASFTVTAAPDSISCILIRSTATAPISYDVLANGTRKQGNF